MMKKSTRPIYNYSIAIFYNVLKNAWNLYLKYQKDFAALSDIYTQEYGQAQLKAIAGAQALPDNKQRQGSKQKVGNKLIITAKRSIVSWKQLRGFIVKSFAPADVETALKEAGNVHFKNVGNYNYGEVSLLLSDGFTFLSANEEALTKGGMPDRFIENFTAAKTAFDTQQLLYSAAKSNAADGTTDKIAANNTLYTNAKNMLADGVTIFAELPETAGQFTFTAIERLITVDTISGIHFIVRNSETKLPLPTAVISITGIAEPFTVNKRGVLDIRLPKASYYYTVTIPGYNTFQGTVRLDANVMRRAEVYATKTAAVAAVS